MQFSIFISGFRLSLCLSSCCLWRESIICLQYQNDCQKKKKNSQKARQSLLIHHADCFWGVDESTDSTPTHSKCFTRTKMALRREVSKPNYNPWARTLIIWAFITLSSVPCLLISILLITGCHLCSERTLLHISQCLFIIRTTL